VLLAKLPAGRLEPTPPPLERQRLAAERVVQHWLRPLLHRPLVRRHRLLHFWHPSVLLGGVPLGLELEGVLARPQESVGQFLGHRVTPRHRVVIELLPELRPLALGGVLELFRDRHGHRRLAALGGGAKGGAPLAMGRAELVEVHGLFLVE
jgi:hypothetical protein